MTGVGVICFIWDGDSFDTSRLDEGRVFSSYEAAEEHAATIRAQVELR